MHVLAFKNSIHLMIAKRNGQNSSEYQRTSYQLAPFVN